MKFIVIVLIFSALKRYKQYNKIFSRVTLYNAMTD